MTTADGETDRLRTPGRADIAAQRIALRPYLRQTPVFVRTDLPGLADTRALFKYEHLQVAGTFKARGAFSNLLALDSSARAAGVTAFSAGNHAVAVAYAAQHLGIDAKVVMLSTANPARVALARRYGAEVLMAPDGATGFAMVADLERDEGRSFVHPFNFYRTILGTATLGAEWADQALASELAGLDAVVLPVGGGGLAAGVATAFKLAVPGIEVYGVEPEGADGMARSFARGGPVTMGKMHSIADSLMAPRTEAYSYGLCRQNVDALVTVDDAQLREAMRLLFDELKLAVEPACAAATAGALGPLRERIAGRRVGILLCGSIMNAAGFARHMAVE
jgi:threonine dehydratase